MVNETSYITVKTFTRLHIYRSSSPSGKGGVGGGREEGVPSPLRVSICPKNKVAPGSWHFAYAITYRRPSPPPPIAGVQTLPAIFSVALFSMP